MQLEEPWGDELGGAIASSPEHGAEDDSDGLELVTPSKGKPKAKAKGKPRNPPKDAKCFVLGCEEKKAGKHRWCHPHKRTHETLKKQAADAGPDAVQTLAESCEEAAKAKELFDDFESVNPGGKWTRKKMVDDFKLQSSATCLQEVHGSNTSMARLAAPTTGRRSTLLRGSWT